MEIKLSTKGRVVLPASFGANSIWHPGDVIEVQLDGSELVLTPTRKRALEGDVALDPITGLRSLSAKS